MKTHVYLNPMSPDGTPGEVKEIQINDEGPRQFMAPVSYVANDAERAKLRKAVLDAETNLLRAQSGGGVSPTELLRFESAVKIAKRDLDVAEDPRRQQRLREGGVGRDDAPPPAQQSAPSSAQFAEIVDYTQQSAPVSEEVKALRAKVAEAVKALGELRASGAAATKIMRAEEAVRLLKDELASAEFGKGTGGTRDQAPPTTDPPLRTKRIGEAPTVGKNSQSFAELKASVTAAVAEPKVKGKKESGLARWIREVWTPEQERRLLEKFRQGETTIAETAARPAQSTHSAGVCCAGKYRCEKCAA